MQTTQPNEAYRFVALDPVVADEYRRRGVGIAVRADSSLGYPCRQCLRDAEVGEELLLVAHNPFDGSSPYTSPTPIYIHRAPCAPYRASDTAPRMLLSRLLSLRGFDRSNFLQVAKVTDGDGLESTIAELLREPFVDYIDVHNAAPGCWNCRIERRTPRPSSQVALP